MKSLRKALLGYKLPAFYEESKNIKLESMWIKSISSEPDRAMLN